MRDEMKVRADNAHQSKHSLSLWATTTKLDQVMGARGRVRRRHARMKACLALRNTQISVEANSQVTARRCGANERVR
jgi:hypothetical protein